MLVALAETLRPLIRKSDILGRLGGEEFALLMIGADRRKRSARPSGSARRSPTSKCSTKATGSSSPRAWGLRALRARGARWNN
ncbi:diguanylate cyclase [Proteobacteria bacterium 005FR1]|nr:diguanylate cyclase [Proteobacteria bacterium 005FR1]